MGFAVEFCCKLLFSLQLKMTKNSNKIEVCFKIVIFSCQK